ncbi:MAG: BMP family protein [Desulfurococcales archaeon]|nr:BMP family protein [Desulfurococcales archaeon]
MKPRPGVSRVLVATVAVIVIVAVIALVLALGMPGAEEGAGAPQAEYRLAAIFPGSIQDADYNTIGYLALVDMGRKYGIDTAYTEKVAVPDAERIMKEYISLGYNIIWAHGGQFLSQILKLANEYPDVIFIAEADSPLENQPDNVWVIDRNFHTGFYVLGAIAALSTSTGKIGYIGGLELPFSKAEVNAAMEAIKRFNPDAQLIYVWVGDFNDPVKTRSIAESLIAQGVDFILSSVNLGNFGLFEAVKASGEKVLVTVKYTDKSSFIPENFVTSYIYNFSTALDYILDKIINGGQRGGYYKMEFGRASYILLPLKNVPGEVESKARQVIDDIINGRITVEFKPEIES